MCGIFGVIDSLGILQNDYIYKQFDKGKHRGPDYTQKLELGYGIKLGFHRLAINQQTIQPIIIDHIALVCNGTIYNYKELYKELNITPVTDSTCEIIIHLYNLYGIDQTLQILDGEFSFILYDMKILDNNSHKIYIARDPLGIKPLYILRFTSKMEYSFICASELKMLTEFYTFYDNYQKNGIGNDISNNNSINSNDKCELSLIHFTPGTYSLFEKNYVILSPWKETKRNISYFNFFSSSYYLDKEWIIQGIQQHLYNAVKKRYINNKYPSACLLSDELSNTLITSLICKINQEQHINKDYIDPITTYSIGFANSYNLNYSRKVACLLNTIHYEIIITKDDIINAIPEVIKTVESFDINTVRQSITCYLLGKYINNHCDCDSKIIFIGKGSYQLCENNLNTNC